MNTFYPNERYSRTTVRRTGPDSVRHRTAAGGVLFDVSVFPTPGSTARLTLRDAWLPRHSGDSIVFSKPWSPDAPFRCYAGGARPHLTSKGLTADSSGHPALRAGLGLSAPIEPVPSCFCLLLIVCVLAISGFAKMPGETYSPIGPLQIRFAPFRWALFLSPHSHDSRRKGIHRYLCSQRSLPACGTYRLVRPFFQTEVFEPDANALHHEQCGHRCDGQSYSWFVSEARHYPDNTAATSQENTGTTNTQRGLRLAAWRAAECLVRRGRIRLFDGRHHVTIRGMIARRRNPPAREGADSSAKNGTQLDCRNGLVCEFLGNCVCRTDPIWVTSSVRLLPRDALQ